MVWIFAGVLAAIVGVVWSGLVPVAWVVYCFATVFILTGLMLFFAYFRSKHHGLLLLGITYTTAAVAALMFMQWWPLMAGLALAWMMRAMGIEPEPEAVATAVREGEKKT